MVFLDVTALMLGCQRDLERVSCCHESTLPGGTGVTWPDQKRRLLLSVPAPLSALSTIVGAVGP